MKAHNSQDISRLVKAELREHRNITTSIASSYDFFYFIDGKTSLICKEENYIVHGGDLFMAVPGQAYMLAPGFEPGLFINISIDPDFFIDEEIKRDKYLPCLLRSSEIRQAQLNLFYRIYEEIFQENYQQIEELTKVFLEKLPWLDYDNEDNKPSDKKIELIAEAASIFEEEDPSLERLSSLLDISPSYLSRVFKEITGSRFSDFSQKKKLERSSKLLLTEMSIEEIALDIGFTSSKSLNRIYRQFVNATPSNYRKYIVKLASKKTDQSELRYKCGFQNFTARYSEPSYTNTMTEYLGEGYNHHQISLNSPSVVDPTLGFHAITLDNFGKGYLEEIKLLDHSRKNTILSINIKVKEDDFNDVYFSDLKRWGSLDELLKLLTYLKEIESPPIFSVELVSGSIKDLCNGHKRDELSNYIKTLEGFFKLIIQNIGRSTVEKYLFVFDTSVILDLTSQKAITYFFEYMEKRHIMMERVFYTINYISVYELGKKSSDNLEAIIDFISKNRHRIRTPTHSYAQIILPQVICLSEPHQLLGALKVYNEVIEELNEFEEDDRLKKTKIKLQGLEMKMDLDFVDPLYFDLFFSILALDLWMNLKGKSRILPDYSFKFTCKTKKSVFNSKLIDSLGFPTTFYHINNFISQMPQDVIYQKEGCLVSKKEDEIHLLIYTNPFVDYSFSLEKSFDNLDNFNREIAIDILNMKGKYKETTHIISRKHGSPYYQMKNFTNPDLLTKEERDYVRNQSIPKLMVDYVTVDGKLSVTLKLTPFEVIYKTYKKI